MWAWSWEESPRLWERQLRPLTKNCQTWASVRGQASQPSTAKRLYQIEGEVRLASHRRSSRQSSRGPPPTTTRISTTETTDEPRPPYSHSFLSMTYRGHDGRIHKRGLGEGGSCRRLEYLQVLNIVAAKHHGVIYVIRGRYFLARPSPLCPHHPHYPIRLIRNDP